MNWQRRKVAHNKMFHINNIYPEVGGNSFLRNIGTYLPNYTTSHLEKIVLLLSLIICKHYYDISPHSQHDQLHLLLNDL
jgi:hypothetical protein